MFLIIIKHIKYASSSQHDNNQYKQVRKANFKQK